VPAAMGGAVTVIDVSDKTVKFVAGVVPKFTVEAPVKFVPVTVTTVPPAEVPVVGAMAVMVGAGAAVNVYWSEVDVVDTPLGVTTVMS